MSAPLTSAEVVGALAGTALRVSDGTIAVIADARDAAPDGRSVVVLDPDPATWLDSLIALPDLAAVIDLRPATGIEQLSAFERFFPLLPKGGVWVAARGDETPVDQVGALADLAAEIASADRPRDVAQPWREHARSTHGVEVTPRLVALGKSRSHLVKLRDAQATTELRTREPGLDVTIVDRLDAPSVAVDGHDHGGFAPDPRLPDVLVSPALEVRRYDGGLTLPRTTLVHHGSSVLPDSFRWHLAPVPTCSGIRDVGMSYALLEAPDVVPERIEGSYFHFGYNNPGHFGHLMTEAIARLWGWDAAKRDDPTLKMLCRLHPQRPQTPSTRLETQLLPAFGVDPADIVWVDRPVHVDSLYGCTPMWHNTAPFYAHPAMAAIGDRLGAGLARGGRGSGNTAGNPAKVFVTRRAGKRLCRNVATVEERFERAGFVVVQPELLALGEQVELFRHARVLAGFGGAGMFNLAYAREVETVLVLNQAGYHARNEQLFAAVRAAECHTFWSAPDHEQPSEGFDYRAHKSDWEFDLEANRAELDDVLGRL